MWSPDALSGEVTEPAWKTKRSWCLEAADDHMIPVPARRILAERAGAKTVDQAGSHDVYVSQPAAVAAVNKETARGANQERKQSASRDQRPPIAFRFRKVLPPATGM
jgi:hypothetical protein